MKGKSFRRPSTRDLLRSGDVAMPSRINANFINDLYEKGVLVFAGENYASAVEAIENLPVGKFAFLLPSFAVPIQQSNSGIKSLDDFLKIDSQEVLRTVSNTEGSDRLTAEFLQRNKIWPYDLLKAAFKTVNPENPPIGFYWVGQDRRTRATTPMRSITASEMMEMQVKGVREFGSVVDKTPYARSLRLAVKSKTELGKEYEFTLTGLPMHKRGDIAQYSDWMNLAHDSADPDAAYRGEGHEQRRFPVCFWSASTVFAFFNAMKFVNEHREWKQFRINPFPIPANQESVDYIDNLRLKTFIAYDSNGKARLKPLNVTEMDKLVSARTALRGYDHCWEHWGKKDRSYLYTPN